MIYTEMTKKAMKLAYDAHLGKTDKYGTCINGQITAEDHMRLEKYGRAKALLEQNSNLHL